MLLPTPPHFCTKLLKTKAATVKKGVKVFFGMGGEGAHCTTMLKILNKLPGKASLVLSQVALSCQGVRKGFCHQWACESWGKKGARTGGLEEGT